MRKLLTLVFIAVSSQAATVIDFTFNGVKETTQMQVTGSGELSFMDGLTDVTLGQLWSFGYNSSETQMGNTTVLPTVNLDDLTAFNLSRGEDGMPSSVTLTTGYQDVVAHGQFEMGQVFGTGQFSVGGYQDGAIGDISFTVCEDCIPVGVPQHTANINEAPEPAALGFLGGVLLLVGAAARVWQHKRKPADPLREMLVDFRRNGV